MGMVIFLIFSKGLKLKFLVVLLATLPLILFMSGISIDILFYFLIVDLIICGIIYFRFNMPSFFVILCAFIDIFMTLSIINFLGIKVSTAGIIALLMLIGYSVDSDILLTSRVLRSQEGTVNERIKSAFKTGMTMTMTTFAAVVICLIVTQNFSPALKQIFTILTIGLVLDIINTWITNASLIKYYMEKGLHKKN
jgi:preprotein translocase subunit SecF